jgi:hypothetical protein
MLIMAEVTSEMGAELRAVALANRTSVAAEVGRRLERLERLEAGIASSSVRVVPVNAGFKPEQSESLYSGQPNPWDMFRRTSRGR